MSAPTRIKIRLRDGFVEELEVAELIEIDGKPPLTSDSVDDRLNSVIDTLNHVTGRVDALENMLNNLTEVLVTPRATG